MYYLKTEQSFDAAHFLKDYDGKCANLHGHRWRVVACIKGEELSKEKQTRGMLVDFSDMKDSLKKLCRTLDHSFIYEEGSLMKKTEECLAEEGFRMVCVPYRPTAENFARSIYKKLQAEGFDMERVEVYETPNNCAAFSES